MFYAVSFVSPSFCSVVFLPFLLELLLIHFMVGAPVTSREAEIYTLVHTIGANTWSRFGRNQQDEMKMLIPGQGRRGCCTQSQSLSSVAEINPGQVVGLIGTHTPLTDTINTLITIRVQCFWTVERNTHLWWRRGAKHLYFYLDPLAHLKLISIIFPFPHPAP